jgi:hypothetical protein
MYNSIPDATLAGSILLGYLLDLTLPITEIIPSSVNLIGVVINDLAFQYILFESKIKTLPEECHGTHHNRPLFFSQPAYLGM